MSNIISTIAADLACPACQSSLHKGMGRKSDYALSQCSRCRTIFLNAHGGKDAVDELYSHYYDRAQFEIPAVVASSLEKLAQSVEVFRKTNRWLDIGYGEGALLSMAERRGWDCYGTEVSPQALSYGQDRGWTVAANAEDDVRFPHAGFDVVTMIEFIEHAQAPDQFLQAASAWLRPGGLLYITTPNAESLNRRLLGLDWSVFSPPEHVTIWTSHGLRLALRNAGFQARRIRTDGLNPSEIVARFRRPGQPSPPVDRNTAAFALNSAFSSSPFRRAIKTGINRCLTAFLLGDTLKVWAVRNEENREGLYNR